MFFKEIRIIPIGIVEEIGEQKAKIRIFGDYCGGTKDIADFSHLIVLYWIHDRDTPEERRTLLVYPRRHSVTVKKGVFACRSPSRPNPIGLCIVRLLSVDDCVLHVEGLDAYESTPIIDVKPYIPEADSVCDVRVPRWTSCGPKT